MKAWLAYLACLVGVVGHASSEFVSKLAATPGPEFSVWRFMIGGVCLLILTQFWPGARDVWTPLRRDWRRIIGLCALTMAMGQLMFHWSLDFTSVVQVATMVTGIPIFYVVFDWAINRAEITAPKIVSGVGAFLGVVLLLWSGAEQDISFGGQNLLGTIIALACGVLGGLYLILARPLVLDYGPVRVTAYTFAIGAIILWVVVGLAWGVWVNPLSLATKTSDQQLGILTIGVWNTCIAMALWLWGLAAAPDPQRANYLFFLKPVIAAGFAVILLGETLITLQILAIVAICACVALEYIWTERRKRASEATA